jgi:hypothetical protein
MLNNWGGENMGRFGRLNLSPLQIRYLSFYAAANYSLYIALAIPCQLHNQKKMSPSEKPTFVLLRARLPAKDAKRLLGRFVTHPTRPLDNSEPKNPLSIIKTAPVIIEEKSASVEISAVREAAAQAKVEKLVDLQGHRNHSTDTSIHNTSVKTYRLQDHYKAFDKLMLDPELKNSLEGAKGLMSRSGGKLYMVVGIKACSAGTTFKTNNKGGIGFESKLTIPLSEAFGNGPLLSTNPEIGMSSRSDHSNAAGFEMIGEQVFAVEYKKVKQKNIFGFFSASAETQVAHDPMTHEWGNAVFNEKDTDIVDDDAAFDDDENDHLAEVDELINTEDNNAPWAIELDSDEGVPGDVGTEDELIFI